MDMRVFKVANSLLAVLQLCELEYALVKRWSVLGGCKGGIKN